MHFGRLWNDMCNRHRAEITVMQFTGHSLPVHHFVTARWDFYHIYIVPYCHPSCILHLIPFNCVQPNELKLVKECYLWNVFTNHIYYLIKHFDHLTVCIYTFWLQIIYYTCKNRIWHEITNNCWYAINPTKSNHIYSIYMYKVGLTLNNLQRLICHKMKPNQIIYIWYICIKKDLVLNNLQRLMCHKTQPNEY